MSIFTIEGNIGSGKTTLLSELQSLKFEKEHVIVFEQVKEWGELKDENDVDILSLFYKDKNKYSYIFQSYVLFSRLHHMLETVRKNPDKIIICERCHLTDLYVFAKSLHDLKDINEIEWKVYNMWHKKLKEMLRIKLSGAIYIRTSPDICHERINKRNRSAENGIPLEYLTLLHDRHDNWLKVRPIRREDVAWFSLHEDFTTPVLELNGDVDIWDYEQRLEQKNKIIEFINYEHKAMH